MRSSGASADGKLRVICGPTAAGKSALALALAERTGATIVSADSRQIYRHFDIGTAKPSREEQQRVSHRGIDLVDPTERFSAAEWAGGAEAWIAEARRDGSTPIVVGGTGFYIRALTTPLFAQPPLDPGRRRALGEWLGSRTTPELRRWCMRLDPPRARFGRAQLLRALEVALLTGVPLSCWQARAARSSTVAARYLLVDPGPALPERIARRAQDMFAAGWAEEVAELIQRVPDDAPAWNATGYAAVREFVCGRVTREAAMERLVIDTRQYAKRQRTWFRHQLPAGEVTTLDPVSPQALSVAAAWWGRADA
jgi:tRNA dimethylallyltransferase